jgi:hypothetical protein
MERDGEGVDIYGGSVKKSKSLDALQKLRLNSPSHQLSLWGSGVITQARIRRENKYLRHSLEHTVGLST